MAPGYLDLHRDRLVGLAGDDSALAGLATRRAALCGHRAGSGLLLPAALGAVGRAAASGPLADVAAGGCPLVGALLRALLCRAARALQAAAGLPVEALHRIVSSLGRSVVGFAIGRSLLGFGRLITNIFRAGLVCGGFNLLRRFLGRGLRRSLFRRLFFLLLFVSLFFCHQALSSCSRSMPRSLATVSRRATSRRTDVILEVSASPPVAC